jgi:hypothetical protein
MAQNMLNKTAHRPVLFWYNNWGYNNEQENFNFSNVRVIKLESVLSVFAIRINELIIPNEKAT